MGEKWFIPGDYLTGVMKDLSKFEFKSDNELSYFNSFKELVDEIPENTFIDNDFNNSIINEFSTQNTSVDAVFCVEGLECCHTDSNCKRYLIMFNYNDCF